jgi:hypothetical protein
MGWWFINSLNPFTGFSLQLKPTDDDVCGILNDFQFATACMVIYLVVSLIAAKAYFFCLDTKETKTERSELMNTY